MEYCKTRLDGAGLIFPAMKMKYKLILCLSAIALIPCFYKFNAYRESVSSKAAAKHNLEMLDKMLQLHKMAQSNGAVRVDEPFVDISKIGQLNSNQ